MDTLTHALSGALLARATTRPSRRLSRRDRTLTGLVAAAFPDVDYTLFLVAPLGFLNWHRGLTHSLLLLPGWAWLLSVLLARLTSGRYPWQAFYGLCALGIAVHLVGDLITIYGTKLLPPVTDTPVGLGIVFDIDPVIASLIALGFMASYRRPPRRVAGVTLVLLIGYLMLQTGLYWRTVALGEAYARQQVLEPFTVYALPQPFAPWLWKLVVVHDDGYRVTYLNHLEWGKPSRPAATRLPWSVLSAYRPQSALLWTAVSRFGENPTVQALALQVWRQERLAAFRHFAVLPALYRLDQEPAGGVCVWFTDLRYSLPLLPPAFRYGLCRVTVEGPWQLYRLRYFQEDQRQLLE